MTIEQDEDTLAASIAEERGGGEPEEQETETPEEEVEEEGAEGAEDEPTEDEAEEAEAEEGEAEDEQEPEQRTRGRGSARIQRLQRELAEERRRNQELTQGRGQQGQPQQPAFDPQAAQKAITEELAKDFDQFEFKTKEQRAEIFLRAQQKVLQPFMRTVAGTMAGDRDKSAFRESYEKTPFYSKLAPKVEAEFQRAHSQGYFIPREQFYKQMVADLALSGATKSGGQKRAANIRKQKAAGQATSTKGDAGSARGRGTRLQQLEGRLKDVKI